MIIDKNSSLGVHVYVQRFVSVWRKRFGEEVDQDSIYIIAVDRVLQLEDIQEVELIT